MNSELDATEDPLLEGLTDYWEEFLAVDRNRPPGLDSYQDVFDHPALFPLQRQRELEKMITIARTFKPTTVFEIGADKGGGLYHWCKCLTTVKRIIACEIRGLPYSKQFERAFPHIEFLWLPESSYEPPTAKKVFQWTPAIDVLFLDGEKAWFSKDFHQYASWVSHPGVIFFHDITDPSPGEAYRDAVGSTRLRHIDVVNRIESEEAVERERQGLPIATAHEAWLRHWKGSSCGVGCLFIPECTL